MDEQQRPLAAAELRDAEANAQIGDAKAAYFPTITLSVSGGFASAAVESLLDWPSRVWSLGANMSETVFDTGARSATVAQYRAAYDSAVAQDRANDVAGQSPDPGESAHAANDRRRAARRSVGRGVERLAIIVSPMHALSRQRDRNSLLFDVGPGMNAQPLIASIDSDGRMPMAD